MLELRGQLAVATDQRNGRIVMALGLSDLVMLDRAKLTDGTVNGTNIVALSDTPRAGTQSTREEFVKGGVALDIGIRRFVHVHAVMPHEPFDKETRQAPCPGISDLTGKSR